MEASDEALEKALDARGAEVRELHKARIEADADILALRRQRRGRPRRADTGPAPSAVCRYC